MAAKKTQTAGATKVRVLADFALGKIDEVIELDGAELAQAVALGVVDPDPAAVAAAEALAK